MDDTKRLDWIETNGYTLSRLAATETRWCAFRFEDSFSTRRVIGANLREAIDNAIKQDGKLSQ